MTLLKCCFLDEVTLPYTFCGVEGAKEKKPGSSPTEVNGKTALDFCGSGNRSKVSNVALKSWLGALLNRRSQECASGDHSSMFSCSLDVVLLKYLLPCPQFPCRTADVSGSCVCRSRPAVGMRGLMWVQFPRAWDFIVPCSQASWSLVKPRQTEERLPTARVLNEIFKKATLQLRFQKEID